MATFRPGLFGGDAPRVSPIRRLQPMGYQFGPSIEDMRAQSIAEMQAGQAANEEMLQNLSNPGGRNSVPKPGGAFGLGPQGQPAPAPQAPSQAMSTDVATSSPKIGAFMQGPRGESPAIDQKIMQQELAYQARQPTPSPNANGQAMPAIFQGGQTMTSNQANAAGSNLLPFDAKTAELAVMANYKPIDWWKEISSDPFGFLMSGTNGIRENRENQMMSDYARQAAEESARREAQIQTWINSDDPRDRMRLAAALNAEKLGENLGSGFGSQIVGKGQIRDYGFGAQDSKIFNPDTGVSDGQAWQTNMNGTTTWGERQAETPAQKLAREKALQPTIENTGQAIVSVSPDGSNTKVLYQDPATPKSDGITPYQGLQTQLRLNEIDREIETGAQRNRSSLTTLDNSIALLDKFMGDTEKFNAVYGNMMNPTGKKDDLFNWSIGMDDNRKDGMAMLNQLGGQAFIDSIRDMKSAGGAGSVSDSEGAKLATAATRLMEVNQTDVAAREAADEFKLRLITFRNALAQDMAKKETAEKLRRQQVEEMMGGNPGSPVQSSQPTEDDDTFIDKLFGGIGNLFSGGGAQQPPIDLSRLTPQQLEQLEQQLSQGGGR
jgi:hypothetical protein